MKIVFFIRSLGLGGAERQLLILADRLSKNHDVAILTFYDNLEYDLSTLQRNKYQVISLKKSGRWDILGFFLRFIRTIRFIKPDIIYAFMSTASVISLFSKLVLPRIKVVWGVRSSNMRLGLYGIVPKIFRWLECRLSVFADLIISNSFAGRREAIEDGIKEDNFLVISNGIDTDTFKRDHVSRREIRNQLNIPLDAIVIGAVARHDPMKGLEIFLLSASTHVKKHPGTYFLLIGSGPEAYTEKLNSLARSLGLQEHIRWIEKTNHVEMYYSAMDIFTSSSIFGEGFSNAIGEAMSCELPCVITDVGDSRYITGEYGLIIIPESPIAISAAWDSLFKLPDSEIKQLGINSRKRVLSQYSVDAMVRSTETALESALS